MNPPVLTTAAGDPATRWRRIAVAIIVQPVEAATHLHELTDPLLLHARCRLFRRIRVPAARIPVARVPADRDHIEVHSSVRQIY
jgi:hypothetical protein